LPQGRLFDHVILAKHGILKGRAIPGIPMLDVFTRHPRSVDETYSEHMAVAWSFAFPMLLGGLACFVHGVFPFLFETTGSRCVKLLYTRIANRGRKSAGGEVPNWAAFDAVI
jgi:hypothetical protein